MSKTWKKFERRIAEDLGTNRNWKGTSGDIPDCYDDHLTIEAKVQKAVPIYIYRVLEQAESHAEGDRIPIGVVRKKGNTKAIALIEWEKFLKIYKAYKNKD